MSRHARSLPADLLALPPLCTFKADARSRVWLVRSPQGDLVVKRFEYARLRQILGLLVGLHPAQRERRTNRRLASQGIGVVPIAGIGLDRGRVWLATEYCGESLQHLVRAGLPRQRAARRRLIRDVVDLWAGLVERGWFWSDFQVANIVVDGAGCPRLIDVGSARHRRSRTLAMRMLRHLYETARIEGLSRADARRGALRAAERRPEARGADGLLRDASRPRAVRAPIGSTPPGPPGTPRQEAT